MPSREDSAYSLGFSEASDMHGHTIEAQAKRLRDAEAILKEVAELLGMLARPSGRPESMSHIWARCVELELKARTFTIGTFTSSDASEVS